MKVFILILASLVSTSAESLENSVPQEYALTEKISTLGDKLLLLTSKLEKGVELELNSNEMQALEKMSSENFLTETRGNLGGKLIKIDEKLRLFTGSSNAVFYVCAFIDGRGRVVDQDLLTDLSSQGNKKKLETIWLRQNKFSTKLKEIAGLEPLDKAKTLDECLKLLPEAHAVKYHGDLVQLIINGDGNNQLGLREKYTNLSQLISKPREHPPSAKILEKFREMKGTPTDEEIMKVVDDFLKDKSLSSYDRQYAMMRKFLIYRRAQKMDKAREVIQEAIAIDPKSKISENAAKMLEKLNQ